MTRSYICGFRKRLGLVAAFVLTLLGPPSLVLATGAPFRGAGTSKGLALLAYLLLESGPHTREELAALLWSDSPDSAARASLRQTLKRLRAVVGEALRADRNTIQLEVAADCDVQTFLLAAEREPARAATFPVEQFLSGLSLRHAPAFEEWMTRKRQTLVQRRREALRRLARDAMAQTRWREAAAWSERWLEGDPLSDEAARLAIESRFLAGDRGAALAHFRDFRERLRREVGAVPGADLLATAARIESATGAPRTSGPSGVPSAPVLEASLIGREPQWRVLQDVWRAVRRGAGRVVLIEGEAGLGKTRLAEEFLRWTGIEGATVLHGRAYRPTAGMPFAPVIEAARGALDAPGLAGTDPEWLAEAARLLPELRHRFPNLPPPAAPAGGGERWRLYEGVAQVLLALAAERPLLLFIDDVQWCDGETCAMLHFLCRRVERAPMGIVGTLTQGEGERDAPAARLCRVLRTQAHALTVPLTPLTEDEVWRLVREMGRITAPTGARRLAHRLHEASDGNPFYVIELVKTLFAQGLLTVDAVTGEWCAPASAGERYANVELPATVRDAIGERVEGLSYDLRDLLATVAVVGRGAPAELMSHVHGMSRLRVAALADGLVERRLLVEDRGMYRCAHSLIADVVRDRLTPARRREVHRAVALSLAALPDTATVTDLAGEIAWHAERGGERAVAYCQALLASAAAAARCAFEEAAAWLDLAAGVAEPGPETDAVNLRTAEVLRLAGWNESPPAMPRTSTGQRIDPIDLDVGVRL